MVSNKINHVPFGPRFAPLAIETFLARDKGHLSDEHRQAAKMCRMPPDGESKRAVDELRIELADTIAYRALSASITASGGATVPEVGFAQAWELALVATPMRALATVERVSETGSYSTPTSDDTANEGAILGENQTLVTQDVVFGLVKHTPVKFGSGRVLIPGELAEDAPRFASQLGSILGGRIARRQNRSFTLGAGGNDAVGVVTSCTNSGATVTASSSTAITPDDLFGLYAKIGSAYYDPDRCVLMMNKAILLTIKQLKDGSGRPVFRISDDGRLDGHKIVLNHHLPSTIASGTNGTVLFGDFQKFLIVDFRDLRLNRADETHAESDQTLWSALQRSSGNLLDGGTHPIASLVH